MDSQIVSSPPKSLSTRRILHMNPLTGPIPTFDDGQCDLTDFAQASTPTESQVVQSPQTIAPVATAVTGPIPAFGVLGKKKKATGMGGAVKVENGSIKEEAKEVPKSILGSKTKPLTKLNVLLKCRRWLQIIEPFCWVVLPLLTVASVSMYFVMFVVLPVYLQPAVQSAGVLQMSDEVAEAFAPVLRFDTDGDNALSLEEFTTFVAGKIKESNQELPGSWRMSIHCVTRFLQLDANCDNRLSMEEIESNKYLVQVPGLRARDFPRWVCGILWGLAPPVVEVNFLK